MSALGLRMHQQHMHPSAPPQRTRASICRYTTQRKNGGDVKQPPGWFGSPLFDMGTNKDQGRRECLNEISLTDTHL